MFLVILLVLSLGSLFSILQQRYSYESHNIGNWKDFKHATPVGNLFFIIGTGLIIGIFVTIWKYVKWKRKQGEILLPVSDPKDFVFLVIYMILVVLISFLNFSSWSVDGDVYIRILTSFSSLLSLYLIVLITQHCLILFLLRSKRNSRV